MVTLAELKVGDKARVVNMQRLDRPLRKKLMVLGVLPSSEIHVVRFAPLGDPLQIDICGVNIALRRTIAAGIDVEVLA
ncbi:FeoA family protein [Plesiomonas shigelloides]|uniref:FeoA family protein n=1 Tax=Plesiomonas shigelloides TaxID=703 RepID=UPI001C5A6DA6|nr:FeoA family protein [Plesiomonas shigelloides]MBW3791799.1 ferrous iron transport protein A [Plesiomonas shigelloides]